MQPPTDSGSLQKINQASPIPLMYMGSRVRFFQIDGQPWFAIHDIAKVIGAKHAHLRKIIYRNADVFEGWFCPVTGQNLTTPRGGRPELLCVNREGIVALLTKIAPSRIKDPDRRDEIIRFQRWAVSIIADILAGRTIPVERETLMELFDLVNALPGERAALVREAMIRLGRSRGTIYRYLRDPYTQRTGYPPPRQTRSDRGSFRVIPDDLARVLLGHISAHPGSSVAELRRGIPGEHRVSYTTFTRFVKSGKALQ